MFISYVCHINLFFVKTRIIYNAYRLINVVVVVVVVVVVFCKHLHLIMVKRSLYTIKR